MPKYYWKEIEEAKKRVVRAEKELGYAKTALREAQSKASLIASIQIERDINGRCI